MGKGRSTLSPKLGDVALNLPRTKTLIKRIRISVSYLVGTSEDAVARTHRKGHIVVVVGEVHHRDKKVPGAGNEGGSDSTRTHVRSILLTELCSPDTPTPLF